VKEGAPWGHSSIVVPEASTTCSLGPGLGAAIFFPYFFPLWKSPSRGAKCKENTLFLSCNAPAFTFKHCESQKRSWECARDFWRIAKRSQKESFCWKRSILTRSLNRVGFESWELSRKCKGHVSAVKCRQLIDLSSGTLSCSNWSVLPILALLLVREHLYMCSTTPNAHSRVCHVLNYSSIFHLLLFVSLIFSLLLFLLLLCLPPSPSPSMYSVMTTLLSWWLGQRSHRNCGAVVGSGGWQGGEVWGKREMRELHRNIWLTRWCEWESGLSSIVVAEASTTCSLVPGLGAAIFSPYFFPLWKSPSRGAKCKENELFLLCNAPAFYFQALQESKEEVRVRSRLLKNCKKKSKRVFLLEEVYSHS